MSSTALVIGPSGCGKSTSIRNLDSAQTFIINVLDKPLPMRGYKKKYIPITGWDDRGGNYYSSDDWLRIIKCIQVVNTVRPEIKTLVIDDLQYILANEFMRRCYETGYAKYSELANHYWSVIREACACRDDLVVVFLSHNEIDAQGTSKAKTIGKLLDEKITIEGMFTCVFSAIHKDSGYKFLTQTDGVNLDKTPMGMFDSLEIDNDLKIVVDGINNYFNEDIY